MTYTSEVLADGPVVYFNFDSTGDLSNLGSLGGAGTMGTVAATSGTAAAAMLGGSFYYPVSANTFVSKTGVTTGTVWTWETWYRNDLPTANGSRTMARFNQTTTTYFEITIDTTNGYFRVFDNIGTNDGIIDSGIIDGNWHHLAVVRNGSAITMYKDGAVLGSFTGSTGTKTNALVYIGGYTTSGTGIGGWLDEPAFYTKELTSTRIAAHYQAGITPTVAHVNVAVPVFAASGSAPDIAARTYKDAPNTIPAMTASGTAPAVGVTAIKNATITIPAATASATAPNVGVAAAKTANISVQPAIASAIAPVASPSVTYTNQTKYATEDVALGGGQASAATISNFPGMAFKIDLPYMPNGMKLDSATLYLTGDYVDGGNGSFQTNNVAPITTAWDETTGTPVFDDNSTDYRIITFPSSGATRTASIDVLSIVNKWRNGTLPRNGLAIQARLSNNLALHTSEHADPTTAPRIEYVLSAIPVTGVQVTVPAATASATAPNMTVATTKSVSEPVQPALASGSAPAVGVAVTKSKTIGVPPFLASASAPKVTLPNVVIAVEAAESFAYAPDVNQFIALDKTVAVPAMEASALAPADVAVDFHTEREITVPPFSANARMVGTFDANTDRYNVFIPTTVDVDDVWLPLNEITGTTVFDKLGNEPEGATRDKINGTLVGGPVLNISGPELRPGIRFDGVDDWINMGVYSQYSAFGSMDLTVELSLKTTDANGTLWTGGASTRTSSSATETLMSGSYNFAEVKLVNGNLVINNGNYGQEWTVRKNIADGQWHHIVVSIPTSSNSFWNDFNISRIKPHFVMIDGKTEWQRYSLQHDGRFLLPDAFMARAGNWYGDSSTNHLAGELSNVVIRLNYAVSPDTAVKSYYEWSNTTLVKLDPAVASAKMVDPTSAKGNVKRMIALYGLPYGYNTNSYWGGTRDGWGNYYSIFAGFSIANDALLAPLGPGGSTVALDVASNQTPMNYLPVKPFQLEGYLVFPVAIMKQGGSNGGPFSAPGMENGEYIDPSQRIYIDDETGLPRFVDLQKDLAQDVNDFDAITAVNYPANTPWDGAENTVSTDWTKEPRQHNMGLTNSEWTMMRDKLRDSIMEAVYHGLDLWITEPEMAVHCGYIQAYDKHETGARVEFFGPGNIDATGYTNYRARELDRLHINPAVWTDEDSTIDWIPGKGGNSFSLGGSFGRWFPRMGNGQYNYTWQANAKRKIINLEPGLTDYPTWEKGDQVGWEDDDIFVAYARWTAYELIDRSNGGYRIGDEYMMNMWEQNDYTGNYPVFDNWAVGVPRKYIVSAKPQGIVGKPISKEVDFFYTVYGATHANPWKDNIYTIAAEIGSVVRGRVTKGRCFIEFMDPTTMQLKIAEDKVKDKWMGDFGKDMSRWSLDSRRQKETVKLQVLDTSLTKTRPNGDKIKVSYQIENRWVEVEDADLIYRPYMGMNARGLNWLAKSDTINAGDVKVFIPSATATAEATAPVVTAKRSTTIAVTPGIAYAEAKNPTNVFNPDVEVHVFPALAYAEMGGLGTDIKVPPFVASATMPNVTVTASGERVYLFIDGDPNITLFMKED